MWNNILFDFYYSPNFNFSFQNSSNDVILHLIHWQYWWWFWFLTLLILYYTIFIKFVYSKSLKFNPKIVTTYRSHGKWGDLIICLLPISWCLNILTNSTTLLKLLEWQNEANFYTIRVRGKQWYWVYKFDVKSMINELNSNLIMKKIGNNYNIQNVNNEYILNESINHFWKEYYLEETFFNSVHDYVKKPFDFSNNFFKIKSHIPRLNFKVNNNIIPKFGKIFNRPKIKNFFYKNKNYEYFFLKKSFLKLKSKKNLQSLNHYKIDLIINRFWRNNIKVNNELELKKNLFIDIYDLFSLKYRTNKIKTFYNNFYGVIKQRPNDGWIKNDIYELSFKNLSLFNNNYFSLSQDTSKPHSFENIQMINNTRLLKVSRLLVLPTNVHLNIITNSFDVIHSWFIPGLGLKMDCVPGRSTHHTLYIDVPGMYYGQCAEICGRFHHHMPIRVCAMYYDHYYIWWLHMGSYILVNENIENSGKKFSKEIKYFINN